VIKSHSKIFFGEDCVVKLIKVAMGISKHVTEHLQQVIPIKITREQQAAFNSATSCYICKRCFTEKNFKVRDHNHYTGSYRGAAHNRCNLNFKQKLKILLFFHNGQNYDNHFIRKELHRLEPTPKVSVIGQSVEKMMLIQVGENLVIKDSCLFLNSSLAKLT